MVNQKISEKTVAAKFKRLAYFHGQLLTEHDLLEEQLYIREKLKFHNRLHGNGVVQGLKVETVIDDKTEIADKPLVIITPGCALDCEGNEVIVCQPLQIDLSEHIQYLDRVGAFSSSSSSRDSKRICEDAIQKKAFITISIIYGECSSNPSTQYITSCSAETAQHYSRIREGFRVVIDLEYFDHDDAPQRVANNRCLSNSSHCQGGDHVYGYDNIIPLARILVDNKGIESSITEGNIVDIRSFAWTAFTFDLWEQAKERLLKEVTVGFHDLSVIINRSVPEVIHMLKIMKMSVRKPFLSPLKLTEKDLETIRCASSFTDEGSDITLVTDENGEKVLFGIPNREIAKNNINNAKS